jgi:hypothetical protein
MSIGFENRDVEKNILPEFYAICDRILWTPEFFEMTSQWYKERMQTEVENAKWDPVAMAKCMRELQAMVFVLKTALVSSSPYDVLELWKFIGAWEWFEAYKFLQQTARKSEPDVEAATIFIEETGRTNLALKEITWWVQYTSTKILR